MQRPPQKTCRPRCQPPRTGLAAPMQTPESGLSRFLQREAARIGRVPHHRVRIASLDAAAHMVASGTAVAVMPSSVADRWRMPEVRVLPLSDHWARRKLLLRLRADARDVPGVEALVESLMTQEGQPARKRS